MASCPELEEYANCARPKKILDTCRYWMDLHSAESVQTEETMVLLYYARCFNLMCLPDISAGRVLNSGRSP